jgi:hypothetical protein
LGGRLDEVTEGFSAVGLEEVDRRAALQRRVDKKYLVTPDTLGSLLRSLRSDHEILEIEGRHVFEYESTYFDTASLECFHQHVEDRRPRYKARTRCYVDTGSCFFEVKVKRTDGETVKRNLEHDPDQRDEILPDARDLLVHTLTECGVETTGEAPEPKLVTRFRRVTLAARERPERITLDFGIELDALSAGAVGIGDHHVVVETKTPDGAGPCDRLLVGLGAESISLSKYRLGVGMLLSSDDDGYAPDVRPKFSRSAVAS